MKLSSTFKNIFFMAVEYIISPFIENIKYIFLKPSIYGGDILSPVRFRNIFSRSVVYYFPIKISILYTLENIFSKSLDSFINFCYNTHIRKGMNPK